VNKWKDGYYLVDRIYVFDQPKIGTSEDILFTGTTVIKSFWYCSQMTNEGPDETRAHATCSLSRPTRPTPRRYSPSSRASTAARRPNAGVTALRER